MATGDSSPERERHLADEGALIDGEGSDFIRDMLEL